MMSLSKPGVSLGQHVRVKLGIISWMIYKGSCIGVLGVLCQAMEVNFLQVLTKAMTVGGRCLESGDFRGSLYSQNFKFLLGMDWHSSLHQRDWAAGINHTLSWAKMVE